MVGSSFPCCPRLHACVALTYSSTAVTSDTASEKLWSSGLWTERKMWYHSWSETWRYLTERVTTTTTTTTTSIFVRRPSCLELTARTLATNHFNRTFQALSNNVFIRADIALSALETFLFNGLYKFTLLTYLFTTTGFMKRDQSRKARIGAL